MTRVKDITFETESTQEYADFLKKVEKSTKNLSDREVAMYGFIYKTNFDFVRVIRFGTAEDCDKAVKLMREAIESGKTFQCIDGCAEGVCTGDNLPESDFEMWLT